MIIYIHGFGGTGQGVKATIFRDNVKDQKVLAPTLSYLPDHAIDTLEQIIESILPYEEVSLVGSSLGGFYSIYLADKYDLKATLINPSTKPWITLQKVIGQALNYGDLSTFEWNEGHIKMLLKYEVKSPDPKKYLLLTQTGDELLDYKVAVEYLKGSQQVVVEGGDHSFVDFEKYIDTILEFFSR
jgi:uncharacterized protein